MFIASVFSRVGWGLTPRVLLNNRYPVGFFVMQTVGGNLHPFPVEVRDTDIPSWRFSADPFAGLKPVAEGNIFAVGRKVRMIYFIFLVALD